MKLKSGNILWRKKGEQKLSYPPLNQDISCDVAIVGGGIMGALIAYFISKQNLSVVLVDKRKIGEGSTLASTALLMYQLDVMLSKLIKKIGKNKAIAAYKISRQSVRDIGKLIRTLKISCGFREMKVLYLASSISDAESLKEEYQVLKEQRFKVNFLNRSELQNKFSIKKEAAIVIEEAAEVDPYKLTASLIALSVEKGLKVYNGTEIKNCRIGHKEKILYTDKGFKIKTGKIVFATGYESINYFQKYFGKKILKLASSYVMASARLPKLKKHWLKDYLVWETAHPYLYMRTTPDNRIIVGGEDEDVVEAKKRDALIPQKSKILERKFEKIFPDLNLKPEYSWAATFGETKDGLGYVGTPRRLKKFKDIYFALGFGGNGTTFGIIAAPIIARMLEGKKPKQTAHEELFSFER
jgi:glycine/D-amino acid oxidase-like deaminating enzyme